MKISSPAIWSFPLPFFLGNGRDLGRQDRMTDTVREGKYNSVQVRSNYPSHLQTEPNACAAEWGPWATFQAPQERPPQAVGGNSLCNYPPFVPDISQSVHSQMRRRRGERYWLQLASRDEMPVFRDGRWAGTAQQVRVLAATPGHLSLVPRAHTGGELAPTGCPLACAVYAPTLNKYQ